MPNVAKVAQNQSNSTFLKHNPILTLSSLTLNDFPINWLTYINILFQKDANSKENMIQVSDLFHKVKYSWASMSAIQSTNPTGPKHWLFSVSELKSPFYYTLTQVIAKALMEINQKVSNEIHKGWQPTKFPFHIDMADMIKAQWYFWNHQH